LDAHIRINVMSGIRLARQYIGGMVEATLGDHLISSESRMMTPPETIHLSCQRMIDTGRLQA
jgi:hypothetical protein